MSSGIRIGVDLGGTKIEAAAFDPSNKPLARHRVPTPQGGYQSTLAQLVELVNELEAQCGPADHIGIGTPGALSPATGLIKNANSTQLIGHALDEDLQALLSRAVSIDNDANCFALSESIDGAGADAEVVFGVIVGTGTGAGIVVRKRLLTGINAIGGEWGHNPLPWPADNERPGPRCYCGRHGCIETFLSGPGLARDYHEVNAEQLAPEDIVRLAATGDAKAEACLVRYEERMARSLAHVVNLLDPDVIVLGGGLSNIERLYDNVPRLWAPFVFSDTVRTRLLPPLHGDASGVRGAAFL